MIKMRSVVLLMLVSSLLGSAPIQTVRALSSGGLDPSMG